MKAFKTYILDKGSYKNLKNVSLDLINKFIDKFNGYTLISELYKKDYAILSFSNGVTIVIREEIKYYKIDFERIY